MENIKVYALRLRNTNTNEKVNIVSTDKKALEAFKIDVEKDLRFDVPLPIEAYDARSITEDNTIYEVVGLHSNISSERYQWFYANSEVPTYSSFLNDYVFRGGSARIY